MCILYCIADLAGEMLYQWATVLRAPFTYDAKMRVDTRQGFPLRRLTTCTKSGCIAEVP